MAGTGTTRDRVWGSMTTEHHRNSQWLKTQPNMTTGAGLLGAPLKASPPLWLNTLDDMRKHFSLAADTSVAVPSSIERSQLQSPSLITDTPLKLWLKQLDSETLEVLYNKSVVECTKAKLLGQRDENAYRANRIREATHRELEYRRAQPTPAQNTALGTQADQPRAERLHRSVPKGRRQTCSQPVEG